MKYIRGTKAMTEKKQFSFAEAKQIGDSLAIPWDDFGVEQFRMGLNTELEHGRRDPATDVTSDDATVTGLIALAHLNEIPDYYTRLAVMESEAERKKGMQRTGSLGEVRSPKKSSLPIVLFIIIFAVIFVVEERLARSESN